MAKADTTFTFTVAGPNAVTSGQLHVNLVVSGVVPRTTIAPQKAVSTSSSALLTAANGSQQVFTLPPSSAPFFIGLGYDALAKLTHEKL